MAASSRTRILIADDFKVLRDVIRMHLERADDMDVIDEAPDLNDALESAIMWKPDVIIMNDYLPPIDSAHAAALFRERGVSARILVISMKAEEDLVERSFQSGVHGFLQKDEIDEVLVDAIRSLRRGERYVSPKAQAAYGGVQE